MGLVSEDYMKKFLAEVDRQIADRKARLARGEGSDRRVQQQLLPEGMEDRRKLADRRASRQGVRQGVRQKENEE